MYDSRMPSFFTTSARAVVAALVLVGWPAHAAFAQSETATEFEKEGKLLSGLVERVEAASRKAAEIAADADRWLVDQPLVLKPTDQPGRPVLPAKPPKETERRLEGLEVTATEEYPAEVIRSWSLDLWNPEPLKARWLAIRKQDEDGIAAKLVLPADLKAHYEAAQRIRRGDATRERTPLRYCSRRRYTTRNITPTRSR
jgi:hypothetical protein